jgi:hypothetical protein
VLRANERVDYWRLRSEFLDWLKEYVDEYRDARVHAAVQRARREAQLRWFAAPAHKLYGRIRDTPAARSGA